MGCGFFTPAISLCTIMRFWDGRRQVKFVFTSSAFLMCRQQRHIFKRCIIRIVRVRLCVCLWMPQHIGLISFGMVLRNSGAMSTWRKTVGAFFQARLKIYRGVWPPPDNTIGQLHKASIVALFCGGDDAKRVQLRRFLFKMLNGDWRLTHEVQHFCVDGCCPSAEHSTKTIVEE